jgi:hypothetical protein
VPDERELAAGRFLSDNQRSYLTGSFEPPNKNSERQYRSQIRDRTVGGILDLAVVAQNLERHDRELLFNYGTERKEVTEKVEDIPLFPEYRHGKWGDIGFVVEFSEIIQFFWKTYRESGATRDTLLQHFEQWAKKAEHEYRHGFERYEGWIEQGKLPTDVEANFDMKTVDDVDVDALLDRLDPDSDSGRHVPSELSGLEMKALVESGHADIQLKD